MRYERLPNLWMNLLGMPSAAQKSDKLTHSQYVIDMASKHVVPHIGGPTNYHHPHSIPFHCSCTNLWCPLFSCTLEKRHSHLCFESNQLPICIWFSLRIGSKMQNTAGQVRIAINPHTLARKSFQSNDRRTDRRHFQSTTVSRIYSRRLKNNLGHRRHTLGWLGKRDRERERGSSQVVFKCAIVEFGGYLAHFAILTYAHTNLLCSIRQME